MEWKSYEHPRLHIPVYSLYGDHREPTAEMLEGLDVLLVDLQDVGSRYYTFIWTLYLSMRACERCGIAVVVLDRPNPINGVTTEGPVLDPNYKSFVGMHPIPVRHGRTIGELAQQFRDEAFPKCELSVLPMKNWERAMWFDQTGLPWVMPSPNMPTLETATVYPGMCLFEGTNISEGRGTTRPFEIFGAPFIDAEKLCTELNGLKLPGVFFRENYFQPTFQKFAGQLCGGAQIHVIDREQFPAVSRRALKSFEPFGALYPDQFRMEATALRIRMEATFPIEISNRRSNRIGSLATMIRHGSPVVRDHVLWSHDDVDHPAAARRHPMAGSRAAACVRERQTGAASAGTQR